MIHVSLLFRKIGGEGWNVLKRRRKISMWEKFGVIQNIEEKGQEPRILTKWILTEKTDEVGEVKVKARLVVLGNMEEGLPLIQTQSPTCGKDTVRLLLAGAAPWMPLGETYLQGCFCIFSEFASESSFIIDIVSLLRVFWI